MPTLVAALIGVVPSLALGGRLLWMARA